jgi:3-oxoacyl-[acyl-carrier-protein] synthase III
VTNYKAVITGLGAHVPERIITNHDLEALMETSDEWIQKRTGIQQRHWVTNESTSDLALIASQRALENAGLDKKELDLIIFATLSPDHDFPGTGCFLQAKLDVPGIPSLDIRQQCSGFIYGMSVAQSFIESGKYKNILLVGAEVHSKGLDRTPNGRDVSVLFGDGAGAMIISRAEKGQEGERGILSTHLYADGRYAKELWVPAPGSALSEHHRISHEDLDAGQHFPFMNGKKVFVHAIEGMCKALMTALHENKKSLEDVDLFIFHQANLRINQMVAQELKIPEEKVFNTIQRFGNTTAATIPLGLYEAQKAGVLKQGTLVASAAFGSGFTWASALYRY